MPKIKRNLLNGVPFTTIPDSFLSHKMTELSPAELRVMLYIFLHTLGYGKLFDAISYDQFINGITARDGTRIDHGAGVSRRALVSALNSLEHRHHLISRSHQGYAVATIRLEGDYLSRTDEAEPTLSEKTILPFTSQNDKVQPCNGQSLTSSQASNTIFSPVALKGREGVQNLPGEVQFFPVKSIEQVQILPLTKESDSNHENHENRAKAAAGIFNKKSLAGKSYSHDSLHIPHLPYGSNSPEEQRTAVELIVQSIAGISITEATALVQLAFSPERNRDMAYIRRLVNYVASNKKIRTPAAVLTALIKSDQDRTPGGEKAKPYPKDPKRFGKFSLGKYAYLLDDQIPSASLAVVGCESKLARKISEKVPLRSEEPAHLWQLVKDDLERRYRFGVKELNLLFGSSLSFEEDGKAVIKLAEIWQERELGATARSTIALALGQRLGTGCRVEFCNGRLAS
jgi:hypothetical protein